MNHMTSTTPSVDSMRLSIHPKPIISDQTVHLTCMTISSVKNILYIWAQINFYLHFTHLQYDLDKIWYKRSVHNAYEHL